MSAELLKNYLQNIGRDPMTLVSLSTEKLKAQQRKQERRNVW
ncbi:hypothetical protein PORCAN_328 [Porphyromonas crevioricanis JCM 13913]|nr:hypothetical protein PORCAN_328 [Porphyromonas crevioricanis JCM 13913]